MDKQILKKWLNLVLLVAAGVYGTSLLVTVDMDNWRGWTLQEIMLRIPCKSCNKIQAVGPLETPFHLVMLSHKQVPFLPLDNMPLPPLSLPPQPRRRQLARV